MNYGFESKGVGGAPGSPANGVLARINRILQGFHSAIMFLSSGALLIASMILCSSVFLRYFLKIPTDWQDETSVFLLVGATFMCAGYVQSQRGHVGIEALAGVLPKAVNRVRLLFCDLASFLFCAFFAWKSIRLLHEAWIEGQTTSSSLAPPLWIPYGLMTIGMILLSLQILLQFVTGVVRNETNHV